MTDPPKPRGAERPGGARRIALSAVPARIAALCLALDNRLAAILGDDKTFSARSALAATAIFVVGAALFLARLGATEICNFNEGVEALVVQQMVDHGHLLFPLVNGREPPFKPPLFHWTAAALAYFFGIAKASELTVRLPSVFFALAGIAITMASVRRRLGAHAAALSGLILLGSYQYVTAARMGRVDMTLTFFETATLLAFLAWQARTREDATGEHRHSASGWLLAVAVAAGLAVLAKGPVGAVLPFAAIAVALTLERRWDLARRLLAPGPIALFLLVSGSWYVACLAGRQHAILDRQLGSENFARFMGGLGAMPPWYYVKPILLNSAPFSLLVPFAVIAALRLVVGRTRGGRRIAALESYAPILLATFWTVSIVFFSIAAYKRRAYLLPLWPAAAIVLVWWLTTLAHDRRGRVLRGAITALCAGLIVFNAVYIPIAEARQCRHEGYRRAADAIRRIVPTGQSLSVVGNDAQTQIVPLVFYLDRTVAHVSGGLRDAPPGYVLVASDALEPAADPPTRTVLSLRLGRQALALIERGPDTVGEHRAASVE